MVTHGRFPPDSRVEKEALSLFQAGYRIVIYANGIVTERKMGLYKGLNVRYYELRYYIPYLLFVLPLLLRKWLVEDEIDVVHVQDTPMAIPSAIAAASLGIPIVYDVHEAWPKMVAEDDLVPFLLKAPLILWSKVSEFVGCKASRVVITTSDEMASYITDTYNVPKGRIKVFMNTVAKLNSGDMPKIELPADCFKVCFVGNMNTGALLLDKVIESVSYIRDRTNLRLYLVGDGKSRPQLEELTKKLHLEDYVKFTGWMPKEKAFAYISACDVCLLPFKKTFNANVSSPNKLFEYLIFGKPVIMTSLATPKKLLGDAALIWDPPTPKKLAQIIENLYKDVDLRRTIGEVGKSLVEQRYLWEYNQERLLKSYNALLNANKEK